MNQQKKKQRKEGKREKVEMHTERTVATDADEPARRAASSTYTKVDAQCDQLATVVGRTMFTSLATTADVAR